jgi:antitoxin VapB
MCIHKYKYRVRFHKGPQSHIPKEAVLTTTRVFKSGNSQAVRLPKEFSVKSKVLEIFRRGDEIVLREPAKGLARAFELLTNLPDDFLSEGRHDIPPQHREEL